MHIICASAFPFTLQITLGYESAQRSFHQAEAQSGAKLTDILLCKSADFLRGGLSDGFGCGKLCLYDGETILKIFVSGKDCAEKILDEGNYILSALVPVVLGLAQCRIIQVFVYS